MELLASLVPEGVAPVLAAAVIFAHNHPSGVAVPSPEDRVFTAHIAKALDLSVEQVSRIASGKSPVPAYVTAIAELLEALPPKDWPERWRRER